MKKIKYNLNSKAFNKLNDKDKNCFYESMDALVQYIKENEKNPNEKEWNQYAIKNKYLSSKTLGYISGIGFNALCKNLRIKVNEEKRKLRKNK